VATLTDFLGLKVLTPDPTGDGGLAIQNDLRELARRLASSQYLRGLGLSWLDATTLQIATGAALSSDGALDLALPAPVTISTTLVGPGGLDVPAVGGQGVLYAWLVGDSSGANPVTAVLSRNAVAPAMPAGYDRSRRIGAVSIDGAGSLRAFHAAGSSGLRVVHYAAAASDLAVLSGGQATSFTPVDCSALIPEGAHFVRLAVAFRSGGATGASSDRSARLRCTGDSHDGSLYEIRSGNESDAGIAVQLEVPVSPARSFDYLVTDPAARVDVSIVGWIEQSS
jgi:hypothetical protein